MIQQWEIYLVNLNPTLWQEQSWIRPVLIISWDSFNQNWSIFIACPITSKIKNYYWDLILLPNMENWLSEKSEVLWFQIRTISKDRIINKIWFLSKEELNKVLSWIDILLKY